MSGLRPVLNFDMHTWILKSFASQRKGLFRCASGFLETYRVQETKCDGTIDLYNGTDMLEENKDRMYSMTHPNGSTYETCINWNQYYTECRAGPENPFKGAISFDNIGYAWIAIFQDRFWIWRSRDSARRFSQSAPWNRNSKLEKLISLEGWVDIMYYVMDAHSFFSFIYFILLIVIGSFFMINLCLVVIATQFSETKQREQRLMEEARLKFMSNDSTLASYQDCFQNHISAYAFEPSQAL